MKPYIRPPSNKAEKKDKDAKKKPVKKDEAEEKEETVLEIIDDRDMDYTKQDNVDIILNKYKNQQISRRNFDPEFQIVVLNLMLEAQKANRPVKIEILVLLIATHFACAKSSPNGFFERDMWLKTQTKIAELLEDLKNHNIEAKKQKTEKKEDGGDLDTFLSSGDSQILPGIVAFIEKLDQQLYKAFQSLTSTSIEYL